MTKNFCDKCKNEISTEYIRLTIKEGTIHDYRPYEICPSCYGEAIKIIKGRMKREKAENV
ncbi:MAG TPA: hypothetical protein VJC02_00415 [Candidatus Paceibacterota bacterium]